MIPTLLTKIILGINYFSLIYVILISTIYLIQLICAADWTEKIHQVPEIYRL